MKIAVTSKGTDLDSEIDERFGRAAYILIIDTDSLDFDVLDNSDNINAAQGAGIQAASMVSSKGAQALLTGFCGPKAMTAFSGVGLTVFTGQTGTVRQAVEGYRQGNLKPSARANVGEKFGMNGAAGQTGRMPPPESGGLGMRGSGRGMGGGRRCMGGSGRGMGMGRGQAVPGAGNSFPAVSYKKENIEELKKQAAELQRQMEAIQKKIENM